MIDFNSLYLSGHIILIVLSYEHEINESYLSFSIILVIDAVCSRIVSINSALYVFQTLIVLSDEAENISESLLFNSIELIEAS